MIFREALEEDIEGMFVVRTAVKENLLSYNQLRQIGITPESISEMLQDSCNAWVAEEGDRIVGFSIADKSNGRLWALYILPEFEGRGIGKKLLQEAEQWLWQHKLREIWLTTESRPTRALGFYKHLGWEYRKNSGQNDVVYVKSRP